jgi:hypothetical protein
MYRAAIVAVCCLTAGIWSTPTFSRPSVMSDAAVRQQIITESIAAYHRTGHPCACPYDHARNGSACGGRSAYSRPGGAAPLCYGRDVSAGVVADWRREHPGK